MPWFATKDKRRRRNPDLDGEKTRRVETLSQRRVPRQPNVTRTNKYTIITFFPKALFEQYRRVANWFFTLMGVLSLTAVSPFSPLTTILPFVLVVGVSMAKEAVEDYRRHRLDSFVNSRQVLRLKNGSWEATEWRYITEGDLVKIVDGSDFPTDLLLLSSSIEGGTAWVQTTNLDGENALKPKLALEQSNVYGEDKWSGAHISVECDLPNPALYSYTGVLQLPNGQQFPVGVEQLLLRGSVLRNTEWVCGMVVYAGHDSKVMLNSVEAPSKRSHVERQIDKIVLIMLFVMILMSIAGGVTYSILEHKRGKNYWFNQPFVDNSIFDPNEPARIGFYNFLTEITLLHYLIPISLYVSVEIIRVIQAQKIINNDLKMYDEETETCASCRTSNLNEELGMVRTILSDKTGTLTQNRMEFFKCSIAGTAYGQGLTDVERVNATRLRQSHRLESAQPTTQIEEGFNMRDDRLDNGVWMQQPNADAIAQFMRALAVCNTCLPKHKQGVGPSPDLTKYEAESPDEAAFVVAAKRFGFFLINRSQAKLIVREGVAPNAKDVEYQLLAINHFSSDRRRMSVVVREPSGCIVLYCKGADTMIYRLLAPNPEAKSLQDATIEHIQEYASSGLRTLAIAYREVSEAEWATWSKEYESARALLHDRQAALDSAAERLERDLILIGATAIEDKLQDGVPQTLAQLHRANINVWMLTGDRLETALNISFACALLRYDMRQLSLTGADLTTVGTDPDSITKRLTQLLDEARACKSTKQACALVLEGDAIAAVLDKAHRDLLLQVTRLCATVICCRMSPRQKAELAEAVGTTRGHVTLAIGDGANDVGMIQASHIGVGISGQEGRQAVMAADFAIAQFRFLERLLLWHGRLNYRRMARMVNYFFYKNIAFGLTLYWYNIFAMFSGTISLVQWFLSTYNIVWTSIPGIILAIWDQDVDWEYTRRFPQLYVEGQYNLYMTFWEVTWWMLNAFAQSAIVFFAAYAQFGFLPNKSNGLGVSREILGTVTYAGILLAVTLQICLIVQYWHLLLHIIVWASILLWFIVVAILPNSVTGNWRGYLGSSGTFWLTFVLAGIAALLPDFTLRVFRRYLRPKPHQVVQEIMQQERRQRVVLDPESREAAKDPITHDNWPLFSDDKFSSDGTPTPITAQGTVDMDKKQGKQMQPMQQQQTTG